LRSPVEPINLRGPLVLLPKQRSVSRWAGQKRQVASVVTVCRGLWPRADVADCQAEAKRRGIRFCRRPARLHTLDLRHTFRVHRRGRRLSLPIIVPALWPHTAAYDSALRRTCRTIRCGRQWTISRCDPGAGKSGADAFRIKGERIIKESHPFAVMAQGMDKLSDIALPHFNPTGNDTKNPYFVWEAIEVCDAHKFGVSRLVRAYRALCASNGILDTV